MQGPHLFIRGPHLVKRNRLGTQLGRSTERVIELNA